MERRDVMRYRSSQRTLAALAPRNSPVSSNSILPRSYPVLGQEPDFRQMGPTHVTARVIRTFRDSAAGASCGFTPSVGLIGPAGSRPSLPWTGVVGEHARIRTAKVPRPPRRPRVLGGGHGIGAQVCGGSTPRPGTRKAGRPRDNRDIPGFLKGGTGCRKPRAGRRGRRERSGPSSNPVSFRSQALGKRRPIPGVPGECLLPFGARPVGGPGWCCPLRGGVSGVPGASPRPERPPAPRVGRSTERRTGESTLPRIHARDRSHPGADTMIQAPEDCSKGAVPDSVPIGRHGAGVRSCRPTGWYPGRVFLFRADCLPGHAPVQPVCRRAVPPGE